MTPPADVDIDHFAARFAARKAVVAVIGLGYVGLPLAMTLAEAGVPTLGFDIDRAKVDAVAVGRSVFTHIPHAAVAQARATGRLDVSADPTTLARADALLICVPTPIDARLQPDLSDVTAAARMIAAQLRPGQLVILESTTFPGTTADVLAPLLTAGGLTIGRDLFLAYSPEREDPGNARFSTSAIPKVVGADDPASARLAQALYASFVAQVVMAPSTRVAEAAKLTENVFRSVNIALVNELKGVFAAMGVDIWPVVAAARTKPFGFMAFEPGPGAGGHCIPVDPYYLTWAAAQAGASAPLVALASAINREMPARIADVAARALGGLAGRQVLVLGVAYKKNVDDVRESPALALILALEAHGTTVSFHDPHVATIPATHEAPALTGRVSVPLTVAALAAADAVIIVTDHDAIDWKMVAAHAAMAIDTRDALRKRSLDTARLVLA